MTDTRIRMLIGAAFMLILGSFGGAIVAHPGEPFEVRYSIDAEHNVICYTYREAMDCFTYVNQGTHLELMPKELAL